MSRIPAAFHSNISPRMRNQTQPTSSVTPIILLHFDSSAFKQEVEVYEKQTLCSKSFWWKICVREENDDTRAELRLAGSNLII